MAEQPIQNQGTERGMADGKTEQAKTVRAMCALVVKGAFDASLIPAFAAEGGTLDITWAPTTVIQEQVDLTDILDRAEREATAWPLPWVVGRPDLGT